MSEREIRETVRAVMAELDRRARGVRRGVRKVMLPAAMGTALALSGCDSGREASTEDARAEMQVPGVDAAYLAPDVAVYMGPDAGVDLGPGPDAAYMAPDVMPDLSAAYIAPDALPPEAGVVSEMGLLYMAPGPDAASEEDAGMAPLYMASDPGAGRQPR